MIPDRVLRAARPFAAIITGIAGLVSLCETAALAGEMLVELDTRPGVTVPLLVDAPEGAPAAVALLFPGGNGKVALWKFNPPKSRNFLVRARADFVSAGLAAVVVDVPSDRRRPGLDDFRDTMHHRADIATVIDWTRARWKAPVWLVGTSRGTVSAAHLGAALKVDGLVLSSSVTVASGNRPANALDAKLEAITAPVLLVHHKADGCRVTPLAGVGWIRHRLTASRKVETLLFEGGDAPQSNPCRAMSTHGFLGIETQVIEATAARIKALSPAAAR